MSQDYQVAVVGASSLKGKEVKEVLALRGFPTRHLTLLDDEDLMGRLTEFQGEPTFIRTIDRESFQSVDFAFFTGDPIFTRNCWKMASREGCRIIDLSDGLEGDEATGASVAGPLVTGAVACETNVFVAAHPAALVVALVLSRLAARFTLARAIVHVFEPASERGEAGVEELHQQTVSLLSFHEVPQKVFDTQVAFNLLPACGEDSRPTLVEIEQRIERHLDKLLAGTGGRLPRPSLRVAQSPTFHGHSFSFYLEIEGTTGPADLESVLASEELDVRRAGEESPSAVGAASSEHILVGDIRADRASPRGYWLWAAADNLRLQAINAVRIAEKLAGR